jgi:hypothetical protein
MRTVVEGRYIQICTASQHPSDNAVELTRAINVSALQLPAVAWLHCCDFDDDIGGW